MSDSVSVTGTAEEIAQAFQATYNALTGRIKKMLAMPIETMQPEEISRALGRVGNESWVQ